MVNDKQITHLAEKSKTKSNGEQSDLCDLEKVTLKPQLQACYGEIVYQRAPTQKTELFIRRPPRGYGEINYSYSYSKSAKSRRNAQGGNFHDFQICKNIKKRNMRPKGVSPNENIK